jgi:hypothetical protein
VNGSFLKGWFTNQRGPSLKKLKIRKIKKSLKNLDYSFTPPPSWKRLSDQNVGLIVYLVLSFHM